MEHQGLPDVQEEFPSLLFRVLYSDRLLQITESLPAGVLSGCVVWGNSERLLTHYLLFP